MACHLMTSSENDEINELISMLHEFADKHHLSIPEMLGRIEMVKHSLWFNSFGNQENFYDLDKDGDDDDAGDDAGGDSGGCDPD